MDKYIDEDSIRILEKLAPGLLPAIRMFIENGESPESIREYIEGTVAEGDRLVCDLVEDAARYYEERK